MQLTGEGLELLLWRNLTGLTLDDCTGIKTFNFGDVLGASVQRLSLSRTLVDDRALASFRRNERLSSVNLAGCKNLTDRLDLQVVSSLLDLADQRAHGDS